MTSIDVHERPDGLNSGRSSDFEKKGRRKLRMTIWFSRKNYEFPKENYDGRISEIMNTFETFLRTNQNHNNRNLQNKTMRGEGFEPSDPYGTGS